MEHHIKLKQPYCDPVLHGEKTFEVRNNDRNYQRGDRVVFIPVDESGEHQIEHSVKNKVYYITYVHSGLGLAPGFVVFGIKDTGIVREPGSLLNLHLSVSTRNVLARNGIKSINALESLTYWELLQLRSVGKKTAEEIEQKMREYKGTPDWQFYR